MNSSDRRWAALAALNGLIAVAAGAFGAHAVSDERVRTLLQTGSQHQLAHALAAIACLGLTQQLKGASLAARLFGAGALVFGGSLHLLAVTGQRWLGAVTPLGGLLLLAGWAVLLVAGLRRETPDR